MRTLRASRGPRRLAVIAIASLLVAGCTSTGSTPSPAPTAAPTPTSPPVATTSIVPTGSPSPAANPAAKCGTYQGPATTITYAIWGDTTELANQQKIVDAFTAKNPSIKVKVTVADWDTYWDKLQTSLAGGNAPDVFVMDGPLFPDYQTRDQLLDLNPLIARDGFDTGQLADLGVKDFTAPDGHLYGLPRDLSTVALYYNKKMFDQAGIPYPDDSWTWDKLVEVATKLTKTSGGATQWGFYTETTDMENYWSSLVWQAGGDILSPDKKTVVIDTDQAAAGLQFLQDLIYKYKVMAQPVPGGAAGDLFENGQAAMEANGSWLVPTHEAAGIDFGVAPLPRGPAGQATSVNPSGVVVYKGTKSPEAAWEFVKCYTGPDMQAMVASLKASMPANKQTLADIYATSFDGGKTFAGALAYAHLKPSFRGYNEFTTALQDELDSNVFNDNKLTAKAALDEVTPTLKGLLGK
ncbi:MAG: sugar ABC transporter substrate-binding protein [Candidatus Limnocylindrales bacterium]|jgi:multiple sugar transport system substrate-binding protein